MRGRRNDCHRPARNRARALPDSPETTTSVSPRRASDTIRRKSAISEMREMILGIRFSRISITSNNTFDDAGCGLAFQQRKSDDLAAPAFDFGPPHNTIKAPVRTLHENVRMNLQDGLEGRVLVKRADEIDHFETRQQFGTLFLAENRPARAFDADHRTVGIDRDDQGIAKRAGLPQKINVSRVQNIEAPIGKDDLLAGLLQGPNLFRNLVEGINSRRHDSPNAGCSP